MAVVGWLAGSSALIRLATSPDAGEWSVRTGMSRPPLSVMPLEYLTPATEDRAAEVQGVLADRGQYRAPSIPDLLIAAVAELAHLTVLHLDKDFTLIAAVTGQPLEQLRLS